MILYYECNRYRFSWPTLIAVTWWMAFQLGQLVFVSLWLIHWLLNVIVKYRFFAIFICNLLFFLADAFFCSSFSSQFLSIKYNELCRRENWQVLEITRWFGQQNAKTIVANFTCSKGYVWICMYLFFSLWCSLNHIRFRMHCYEQEEGYNGWQSEKKRNLV